MNYLIEFLHGGFFYVVVFLVVLTVLVFVHELGHYLIARRNGVKVEVFSIGFGKEILGYTDRKGTRWRLSMMRGGAIALKIMVATTWLSSCESIWRTSVRAWNRSAFMTWDPY